MKKVLIITFNMIPHSNSWGGCQRMYFLAEYLKANKVETTVISNQTDHLNFYGQSISFEQILLPVRSKFWRSYVSSRGTSKMNKEGTTGSTSSVMQFKRFLKKSPILIRFVSNVTKIVYNDPSALMGYIGNMWVKDNKEKILEVINERDIKNVIVSGPPFSIFNIIKHIRKHNKDVNIIQDYRDPWNLWNDGNLLTRYKEKVITSLSSYVVGTNKFFITDMQKVFGIQTNKCVVVSNGYAEDHWKKIHEHQTVRQRDQFIITYTGSIDFAVGGYRDATNLLDAYIGFSNDKDNCLLRIVGVNDLKNHNVVRYKEKLGEKVEFIGYVDPVNSLEYLKDSSCLLLIHIADNNSSKYIISGKYYDYIKSKKAILSIGSNKSAHRELVEELNIGLHVTNHKEEIKDALEKMYSLWKDGILEETYAIDDEAVTHNSREYQNKRFLDLLIK